MPFVSAAQRGWMFANEPEMAKRWAAHTPKGKKLPERVKKAVYPALEKLAYGGAAGIIPNPGDAVNPGTNVASAMQGPLAPLHAQMNNFMGGSKARAAGLRPPQAISVAGLAPGSLQQPIPGPTQGGWLKFPSGGAPKPRVSLAGRNVALSDVDGGAANHGVGSVG